MVRQQQFVDKTYLFMSLGCVGALRSGGAAVSNTTGMSVKKFLTMVER